MTRLLNRFRRFGVGHGHCEGQTLPKVDLVEE